MAEDSGFERTEDATPRRLEQARDEGRVARSRELSAFATLLAAAASLWFMGAHLGARLSALVGAGLSFAPTQLGTAGELPARLEALSSAALGAFAPLLAVGALVALGSPLLVNGWLFTLKPLAPDWSRLGPLQGLSRMLSWHGAIELLKALLKAAFVGGVTAAVMWHDKDAVLGLAARPLLPAIAALARLVTTGCLAIIGAMAVVALVDVPFQLWEHQRRLRMTREELREESKETEGDPRVKARIRSQQREAARKRMMAEVPKADVVVTNPTHYAVALRYQDGAMRAPRVVAKGAHLLAARIRETAEKHRVPVLETPALARALYRHADLGNEIPVALYAAVAEVLAYVYQLRQHRRQGGAAPAQPGELPVPAELDPEARSA